MLFPLPSECKQDTVETHHTQNDVLGDKGNTRLKKLKFLNVLVEQSYLAN